MSYIAIKRFVLFASIYLRRHTLLVLIFVKKKRDKGRINTGTISHSDNK